MTYQYEIRSWHSTYEEIYVVEGVRHEEPLAKAAVGVIIANPFAGQPYQDDLSDLTEPSAALGHELGRRAVALLGRPAESYGKGGIAGLAGAQEHVVACITTVFGNAFRESVGGGRAWISSMTKVAPPGTSIDIPLAFKDEVYVRAYYDGITFTVPTGPLPDELLICVAVASGPRLNQRVGGMTKEEALARLAR
jgi:Protein of unknown function (DUF1185).